MLFTSFDKQRLAHAYLFYGPRGVGKNAMALSVASSLICRNEMREGCGSCDACQNMARLEHPGFRLILPVPTRPRQIKEAKYTEILRERALQWMSDPYREIDYSPELTTLPIIGIEQIRAMKKEVLLKLAGGGTRVFILAQAEEMNPAASNSLLKLLEEPPAGTILILTTSIPGRLLKTITSRCQLIRFDPLSETQIAQALTEGWSYPSERAAFYARIAGGSLQRALSMVDEGYEDRRRTAIRLLEKSCAGDPIERLDLVEDLTRKSDKVEVREILHVLLIWMRDIYHVQLDARDRVLNIDSVDALNRFASTWSGFDSGAGLRCVERAIDYTEKNVYLPDVLFFLSHDLFACVQKDRQRWRKS